MLSNEPLQDAINAAYYRYLLPPDHISIEAWIHNTILAQFPDLLQSTKTLPVCEGNNKPSHNKKQQQSLLSTLVSPQSPSLQAHQNAHRALTKISQSSQGISLQSPGGKSKASSGKTFAQNITLDKIDMDYLAACDPRINLYSEGYVLKEKIKRPDMVRNFQRDWNQIPDRFIPNQLKVSNS